MPEQSWAAYDYAPVEYHKRSFVPFGALREWEDRYDGLWN